RPRRSRRGTATSSSTTRTSTRRSPAPRTRRGSPPRGPGGRTRRCPSRSWTSTDPRSDGPPPPVVSCFCTKWTFHPRQLAGGAVLMQRFQQSRRLRDLPYVVRGPILTEAMRLEAEGHDVLRLNLGNMYPFGLEARTEIVDAVDRDLVSAQAYSDSRGIPAAREA